VVVDPESLGRSGASGEQTRRSTAARHGPRARSSPMPQGQGQAARYASRAPPRPVDNEHRAKSFEAHLPAGPDSASTRFVSTARRDLGWSASATAPAARANPSSDGRSRAPRLLRHADVPRASSGCGTSGCRRPRLDKQGRAGPTAPRCRRAHARRGRRRDSRRGSATRPRRRRPRPEACPGPR